MALTDEGWRLKVCKELGRGPKHPDHEEFLADIESLWDEYAEKVGRLRYLYVKCHGVDLLLGQVWEDVDYTDADVTEKLEQQAKNLQRMRDNAEAEIKKLEEWAGAAVGGLVGELTTKTPAPRTTAYQPDPNDAQYRGHPLRRVTLEEQKVILVSD